jgi:hypothetical protein
MKEENKREKIARERARACENVKRFLKRKTITEEEAKAITEITAMHDVLQREINTSDNITEAIKHYAVFIKDLDEVAVTGKPCYYIYRESASMYKDHLVDLIIEKLGKKTTP